MLHHAHIGLPLTLYTLQRSMYFPDMIDNMEQPRHLQICADTLGPRAGPYVLLAHDRLNAAGGRVFIFLAVFGLTVPLQSKKYHGQPHRLRH